MPAPNPADVRNLLNKVMGSRPSDVRLFVQRLHDHAFDERMSGDEITGFVRDLGYPGLEDFCETIGLSSHVAERWSRFGVSGEVRQMLILMTAQRAKLIEAIDEFESTTHVGIDDFLRERGLI